MLPSNMENYLTYLFNTAANKSWHNLEGNSYKTREVGGKDAEWDSSCRTPVEWILCHKDEMLQQRKPLLQVKWKSLVVCCLGNYHESLSSNLTHISLFLLILFPLFFWHIQLAPHFPWRTVFSLTKIAGERIQLSQSQILALIFKITNIYFHFF